MLKAVVIVPNDRTRDMGSLLAIARAEAQKKEHTRENVTIRSITFIGECGVYVALYEAPRCSKPLVQEAKRK
jgi:hypothetical protein